MDFRSDWRPLPHRRPRRAFLAGKLGRGFEVLEARALLSIDSSLDGSSLLAVTASPSATPSAYSVPAITLTTPFSTDNTAATVRNPQSKVWQHGSDWFAVLDGPALGSDPAGTYVWKLVGTTWVQGPIVINKELLADVKPVGNADTVYAALYGGSKIQLVKLEYRTSFGGNNNYNNYILTSTTSVTLSSGGTDTATIDIDSRGHMWVAYDTASTVEVRYSLAAPYTTWSAPVVLANTSSSDRDITSVIAFGDKIGVMWSDHSTEEWGFRYHKDTDDADTSLLTKWSDNERPGATTDPTHNHNVGNGMADDHLNLKAGSDGTIYAAIKTAYDAGTKANPEHALLVRSPNGTWGPVYGIDGNGTRQIVELNETDGFLRYIYGGETGINDIVYKDIPLSAIDPNQPDKFYSGHDFANPAYPRQTLIGGGTNKMVSSTKQSFGSTLVVVATRGSGTPYTTSEGSAPFFIVGAILTDSGVPSANLPPVNTVPGTQTTLEDIPLAFSTAGGNRISISDPDAGAANVRVTLTIAGGTATIGTSGLTITGNGTTSIVATGSITNLNAALGSLVFTPTLNSNTAGSINILTDDLGNTGSGGSQTDSDTVTINITPVNDAPSFVKGADQTVLEDSGLKTVTNWATAASAGPANESAQTLTYSATNNNPTLFSVQPAVAANGTLTFTPAANAFGTATVSVTLTDSGGTTNGGINSFLQTFVITVAPVNDEPFFTKGTDQTGLEDSGLLTIAGWATAISAGAANESAQTLNFIVTNNNNALFSAQPAIAANGTLTYTPAANASGSATVSVSLHDDGGTAGGGDDTTAVQTFVIVVTPVNDAPSFIKGPDQTLIEDSIVPIMVSWATSIGAGPPDEAGQTVSFEVSNDNHGLFVLQPTVASNGTLSYSLAPDAFGSATVSVTLRDNGGTANGGVDSFLQTFTITITGVNDIPAFVKGSDQTVAEDAGAQTISSWATSVTAGPANESGQSLNFLVSNNNNSLFTSQPAVAADGTLTYTPAANVSGSATVSVSLHDNGGTAGGGSDTTAVQTFVIQVTSINDAPSFSKGADQTVLEDAGLQTVTGWATAIGAGPADESAQTLSFTVTNDNNALFAVQPTVAADGTLTYTPAANANGLATVSVTLHDNGGTAGGGSDSSPTLTFTINVTAVNDVPSFSKGADQTVLEDAGLQSVTGWATAISVGPANEVAQTLSFTVSNDNNALFLVQPAVAADGTLTYTPAANANGSATVSVTLRDNGGTASGGSDTSPTLTFTINVTAVNDAPSFSKGADQTVLEDAGLQTIIGWASAISAGPANEAAQILGFTITNDNNALFAVQPSVAADGTLTCTPAANASGSATVSVTLRDNGGVANGGSDTSPTLTFTINITAVNDAPSFSKGEDQTVLEDAGLQTVTGWATASSAGPANEVAQTLSFTVTNDNNALFAVQPAVAADGTLTYTPAASANGSATVSVTLHDNGGTVGGGNDTSATLTFTINVTTVNDAPSFSKGADQTVLEDAGPQTVTGWATAISAGPADEAAQILTWFVTYDDGAGNTLFSAGPAIAANGTLTYTPAAGQFGTALVSVSLRDDGGTDNGGVDASSIQTFLIVVSSPLANRPPVNSVPGLQTVSEDSDFVFSIANGNPISVSDPDAGLADLQITLTATGGTVSVSASGVTVLDNGTSLVTLIGSASSLNNALEGLIFIPASDRFGVASASLTISTDDLGHNGIGGNLIDVDSVVIDITAVNDAPSFTKGADQTVLEDAGLQTVTGWATAISAGPANEAAQTLNFTVTNDNNSLFAVQPAVAADGTLTYTPAANANGSATVSVTLHDNGGTVGGGSDTSPTVTFTINLTAVNDAPSFSKGADQTVLEDAGLQTVSGWATTISAGPADESAQTLNFTVTNDNNSLFAVQPAVSADGTLTYTPAANANGSATVSVTLHDNGGTASGGSDTSPTLTFTINITAGNDAPSFTKGADQTVLEDAGLQTVTGWATAISAGPDNEAAQTLNFTVTNDNNALFAVQPAVAAGGTLTYTPAANANGSATVSVTLHDNGGTTGGGNDTSPTLTFTINVTAVNDAPSFTKGADQTVLEDAGLQTVTGWATAISAGAADESAQTLSFTVTNDNNALFLVQPAVAADGTLTYTPAANANGSATVSVTLHDNGGTAGGGSDTSPTLTFTINITSVNDAPSFSKGADQTVLEDAGLQTVSGWATAISAGPANEAAQTLNFTVTNDNNSLFAVQPAVAADGTLTYTPAANANGSATVSVTLHDNGGGNDTSLTLTFTISVTAVNDAPAFSKGADQTVLEDAGLQTVSGWATTISAGPADESAQTLSFTVTNDNNALFAVQPAVSADGTLTYTPAANANGSATVSVTLHDNGGTAGGGSDTSPTLTFTINVTAVNDAPSFSKGADQTVLEDAGLQTVTGWATALSAGAADESAQTLSFTVTNDNNALFAVQPAVAADGTLTYTPAANANGSATVIVTLHDNGGTTGGGSDTSPALTFTLNVTAVNDAPALSAAGSLTLDPVSAPPAANPGTLVSSLIASVPNLITDIDAGALQGIAVTAADTSHGDWQFSNDGGAQWTSFGNLSSLSRLLAADANSRVRFVPSGGFSGTLTNGLSFRAWDRTTGASGDAASTSANGGTTAFSSTTRSASVVVAAGVSTFATSVGQGSTNDNDDGRAVAVDRDGNVFVAGTFYFSEGAADSPGGSTADIYLARLSPNGSLVWQQIIGTSTGDDRALSIALDSTGNVYVTGEFQGTVDFNAGAAVNSLTSTAPASIFVLKLDANGVFQWVKGYGASSGLSVGYGITVDSAGDVLVTGQYAAAVNFNPGGVALNLANAGSTDIFVLKLNSAGATQWAKGFGGSAADRGVSVTTDAGNRVYVTGAFAKTVDFDPSASVFNLVSAGGTDAFVLRLNGDGTLSFADRMGGASTDEGLGIALDSAGAIYVSGSFKNSGDFNPAPGTGSANVTTLAARGSYDAFIAKLSADNSFQWARGVGDSGDDRARGITALPDGSVATIGFFAGTVDFDPGSGVSSFVALGSRDVFLSHFTTNGDFIGVRHYGGSSSDFGRGIAADANGELLITGRYAKPTSFDTGAGTFNLVPVKGDDIFVAKVTAPAVVSGLLSPQAADAAGPGTLDVSGDGIVAPLDVLLIVNALNAPGNTAAAIAVDEFNSDLDVNLDQLVSPLDVLIVINSINNRPSQLEQPLAQSAEAGTGTESLAAASAAPAASLATQSSPSPGSRAHATDHIMASFASEAVLPAKVLYSPPDSARGRQGPAAKRTWQADAGDDEAFGHLRAW